MLLGKLSSCACSIFQQEVLHSLHQNQGGGLQFVTVNGDINPGVGPESKVLPRSSAALLWERQQSGNVGRWSLSEPGETPPSSQRQDIRAKLNTVRGYCCLGERGQKYLLQIRALWVLQQMILQHRMCSTAVQLFRNNHRKPLRE